MLKQLRCVSLVALVAVLGCAAGAEPGADSQEISVDVREEAARADNIGVPEQELHPSGICRIEKYMKGIIEVPFGGSLKKGVAFYHISDPDKVFDTVTCKAWVGTGRRGPHLVSREASGAMHHIPQHSLHLGVFMEPAGLSVLLSREAEGVRMAFSMDGPPVVAATCTVSRDNAITCTEE